MTQEPVGDSQREDARSFPVPTSGGPTAAAGDYIDFTKREEEPTDQRSSLGISLRAIKANANLPSYITALVVGLVGACAPWAFFYLMRDHQAAVVIAVFAGITSLAILSAFFWFAHHLSVSEKRSITRETEFRSGNTLTPGRKAGRSPLTTGKKKYKNRPSGRRRPPR